MKVNRELVGRRVRWISSDSFDRNDVREHPQIGDEGVIDLVFEGGDEYLVVEWERVAGRLGGTVVDAEMFGVEVELVSVGGGGAA